MSKHKICLYFRLTNRLYIYIYIYIYKYIYITKEDTLGVRETFQIFLGH